MVHLDVDLILHETDNAFKVVYNDEEIWLPKSQISNAKDYAVGDQNVTISVTEWLANKNGWGA